jgi:hypothetical protein
MLIRHEIESVYVQTHPFYYDDVEGKTRDKYINKAFIPQANTGFKARLNT